MSLSTMSNDTTIKGLPPPPTTYDGSPFRIAIVHARWNDAVISALVSGTIQKLKEQGVKSENIVVKTVPGSYELPFAAQKYVSDILLRSCYMILTPVSSAQTN
jgi:6,7-dimethyl-8-ribityllumazine synthase